MSRSGAEYLRITFVKCQVIWIHLILADCCFAQRSSFEICGLYVVEIQQSPKVKAVSLLDTGSKKTMLDPSLLNVIRTIPTEGTRKTRVILPDGTTSFRENCKIDVSLEGGPEREIEAVLLPVSGIGKAIGVELSAVVGMDLILHSPVQLCGRDGTLKHLNRDALPKDPAMTLRFVNGRLRGKMTLPVLGEIDAVLDTAATAPVSLTVDQLESLVRGGNALRIPGADSKVIQADGSIRSTQKYFLREVEIHGRKFKNIWASSGSVPAIGMDLLRYIDLYLDGTTKRLWLIWDVKEGEEHVRIGLSGLRVGCLKSGDLRILEVASDSVSEQAGIKAGDELLAIDGRPAIEWSYYSIRDRLSLHGSKVRLDCSRDGQPFTVEIELKHRFAYPPEWPPEREEFNPD